MLVKKFEFTPENTRSIIRFILEQTLLDYFPDFLSSSSILKCEFRNKNVYESDPFVLINALASVQRNLLKIILRI